MLYRILTEGTGKYESRATILTAICFESFTVIRTIGHWKGAKEKSIIIEINAPKASRYRIDRLAQCIKVVNRQEAILIQQFSVESRFIQSEPIHATA